MKLFFLRTLFISGLLGSALQGSLVHADSQRSLLCTQFESTDQFIRQSIALCLQDLPSRRAQCMRDAEEQFYRCGFQGNFKRMSNRMQSKIILLSFFKNLVTPKNVQIGLSK